MDIRRSHVRIHDVQVLSDDWYVLKKTTFDCQRRDGSWQTHEPRDLRPRQRRRASCCTTAARRTVVLTRQFRFPAYVNGTPTAC